YAHVNNLALHAGQGADIITLSPVDQNLDELPIAVTSILGSSRGSVSVDGGGGANTLTIDDQNNPFASTWTATGTAVTRSYFDPTVLATVTSTISYANLASLAVNGGFGGNTISVLNTAAGTNTTVNSGNGVDVVHVFATTGPLTVNTQQGG